LQGRNLVVEQIRRNESRRIEHRGPQILVAKVDLEREHDNQHRKGKAD